MLHCHSTHEAYLLPLSSFLPLRIALIAGTVASVFLLGFSYIHNTLMADLQYWYSMLHLHSLRLPDMCLNEAAARATWILSSWGRMATILSK